MPAKMEKATCVEYSNIAKNYCRSHEGQAYCYDNYHSALANYLDQFQQEEGGWGGAIVTILLKGEGQCIPVPLPFLPPIVQH